MAEVAIVGAGVAGLAAAYRLRQHGHRVTVLEAKTRPGGLSHTARRGTVVAETGDDGRPVHQTVHLGPGLYANLGPGRLPHHHRRILALCRELGVRLEPYLMSTAANYWVEASTGARYRRRRLDNDIRGWVAQAAWRPDDPPERRAMIQALGDLTPDGRYDGSGRAGDGPPVHERTLAKLGASTSALWAQPVLLPWQATMFQPVGGMDMIWQHLLDHLHGRVVLNAVVERIAVNRHGVRVTWRQSGDVQTARVDWCLSSIPLPLLAGEIRLAGASREFRHAAGTPAFAAACKVTWESACRWWQYDRDQIYGGISYTDHPIQQFWYPSSVGADDEPAVLTGAYNSYDTADSFGRLGLGDRLELARQGGALIHDEMSQEQLVPTDRAAAVAWHRVPWQAGGWCHWDPSDPRHADAFARLCRADGRLVVIGDQVSSWPGWQEGCLESVERAVALVDGARHAPAAPPVPDSAALTVGDHPTHNTHLGR